MIKQLEKQKLIKMQCLQCDPTRKIKQFLVWINFLKF
jgi:hypothetical protein